ncbi:MAG: hypothetical protein AMJ54_01120 [Deltaproteobacteria bacterium SG8_13]|nr:MAG: hypothetical protein AMJ54_01120 [Deltaproteobacteria bacterium SG8_13]
MSAEPFSYELKHRVRIFKTEFAYSNRAADLRKGADGPNRDVWGISGRALNFVEHLRSDGRVEPAAASASAGNRPDGLFLQISLFLPTLMCRDKEVE